MEYNKKICDMAVGDQVEGYYVLKTGQIRTSNSGRPFLAAVVSDRTGSIEAKAWDYAGPISTPDEGQVLKIRGTVTEFRGALQLNMERLRRAEPRDPVDMGSLVATAPIDGERAWAEVEKLVDSMTVSGDQITFVIPEDVEGSEGLTIRVFGRAVYSDGFSQSLHLLEGSSWQAGELYTIPLDSSYTELTMYIGWQEGTGAQREQWVDLLALARG